VGVPYENRLREPTALEVATLQSADVVLFDLVLPGGNGFQIARRLRTKADFRKADLIAMQSDEQEAALFDLHLVKTLAPAELRELLAAVEDKSLATAL